jgi:hypothetical protein
MVPQRQADAEAVHIQVTGLIASAKMFIRIDKPPPHWAPIALGNSQGSPMVP